MRSLIAPLTEADLFAVLTLNNANAAATSVLDPVVLRQLVAQSCYARGIGGGEDGFLIAMDHRSAYESPNFQWFKGRHERFVYIDRIVIAEHARGRGLARGLYQDLFEVARGEGHRVIGCEVNFAPPNPVSDAFHTALGFKVVGRGQPDGTDKTVSYYERDLSSVG